MTKELYISFHGRILDSLGIQMYQSPTAALAELVSNSWDADGEEINIMLPKDLAEGATIIITDDGNGMTFEQCQNRYLNVGSNRRIEISQEKSERKKRPVLGRKGIGKFAGFGIAQIIEVDTISIETGEHTVFAMDLDQLRGSEYIDTTKKTVEVALYEPPSEERKKQHGTKITLRKLKMKRTPSKSKILNSMATRFLLHQGADNFQVKVEGDILPGTQSGLNAQFSFPGDYRDGEAPEELVIEEGWGLEEIEKNTFIKWRFIFTELPIEQEDLRGISIFCRGKIAQVPFTFNLTGGLSGQHGLEYLSGIVQADFVDEGEADPITTERQRINWELDETSSLLEWGQARIISLLKIWQLRRGEAKVRILSEKFGSFNDRLSALKSHERRVITSAITKLSSIPSLSQARFEDLSHSLITSWEGGRLQELISDLSNKDDFEAGEFLDLLIDAKALIALQTAETIKTKLLIIEELEKRIVNRDLENVLRDYVAANPWLIDHRWETFRVETSVKKFIRESAAAAKLDDDEDWHGRMDLVMASHDHLLVIEFMRPQLTIDSDHLGRFEDYVSDLRSKFNANTASNFRRVTGLIVADKLAKNPATIERIRRLSKEDMLAADWETLLSGARAQWSEFVEILAERAPDDGRIKVLSARKD